MVFAPTLTNDEHRALICAANGKELPEIAAELGVSRDCTKNWLGQAVKKFGAENVPHAVAIGFCAGLITEYNIEGFYVDPRKTAPRKAVR